MLQRSPLRAKPRYKPVAVQRHHDRVASLGCLVCGGAATIHHVTGYADRPGRFSRDHWLVVPLCPVHHQKVFDPYNRFPVSVEALGHQGFYQEHGIDLLAEAMRLANETQEKAA
jgi:hypothetical protein